MDIVIREIRESDYSEIVSIWNNELGSHNVNLDNISERMARMNKDENYKIFVALFDNNVVGCISVVQTMALEYEVGYLKINGLAVRGEFQKKGIGSKLLKHAEDYASDKGLSYLILNTGFQRTEAHHFYESKGYDRFSYCFTKEIH
ncbi:GNAT family N-acetyltransferase [Paenibacillus barcinonensis]|uniref:GNAT family N-acetyltransferase n=1 Tax=Paenibacillus barcinonensis TaxID=198119 RepID=A0A2V4W0P1_PAEBA|nr:GNAT family N-acetyltransferase [Paenibacillus barcinonensis]PYE47900.1 putative N-acetyltransferase YhbS [Paenibacillus barcinonensis]QKS59018.1 GNAT family N-acetyltransferase [Paenibacillus barcinonensis]